MAVNTELAERHGRPKVPHTHMILTLADVIQLAYWTLVQWALLPRSCYRRR
jgi:hypothetical protein